LLWTFLKLYASYAVDVLSELWFDRNGCVSLDIAANVFLFIAVTMRRVERHDLDGKTLIVPADSIGW
jgi:hypothetical protein